MTPVEFFRSMLTSSRETAQHHASAVRELAILRISIFIIFLIAIVWFANARMGGAMTICIAIFPFVFGIVVKRFNKQQRLQRLYNNIAGRYQDELDRLNYSLENLDGGNEFVNRKHSYSYDLDIFGDHSLFALVNRTATPDGKKVLADWMTSLPTASDITNRQKAVEELAQDPEWLTHFLAEGQQSKDAQVDALRAWLSENQQVKSPVPLWLAPVLSTVLVAVVLMVIYGNWPLYSILFPLLANGLVLRKFQERLLDLGKRTSGGVRILRSYEQMIRMYQEKSVSAPLLQELHNPFHSSSVKSIQRLRKLLDFLNGRSNMFYGIFDLIFLLDVYLYRALLRWKETNRDDITLWFDNIAVLEALGSLSMHRYANPEYVFPTIHPEIDWSASELGHPLIPPAERIRNDFSMTKGIAIITGSNMSGKSTFLRTVGLNSVLAFMGGVVCAEKLELPLVHLYTAMRTEDDLKSHISSFYAELNRIKGLLESVGEIPTLCLLDEILKGTNTEDRHRGAKGLLNQLSGMNVLGLVSTHDLELGRWGDKNGFSNFSFNSTITGNEIHFDYRISDGVCHSFNASQLMINMGIELPPDDE